MQPRLLPTNWLPRAKCDFPRSLFFRNPVKVYLRRRELGTACVPSTGPISSRV